MSLDTVGPMARDVDGVALLLSRIGGADPRDATSLHSKPRDYARKTGLRGARVGVLTGVETDSAVSKAFDDTVEKIKSAGARVEEVDFGGLGASVPAYYLLMFAEFASAMQRYQGLGFGGPRSLLGRELKRRVLLGTYVSLAEHRQKWYSLALRGKAFVRARVEALLSRHDFLLSPTMPSLPWRLGEKSSPLEEYSMDVLTGFAALAGVPAISFPAGKMVGMQLVAGRFEEARLLSAARELEA
jgi:aspartyl-tRNA(Asn)/glutamyl-tRNA(Gln) amidotransferase subunit A